MACCGGGKPRREFNFAPSDADVGAAVNRAAAVDWSARSRPAEYFAPQLHWPVLACKSIGAPGSPGIGPLARDRLTISQLLFVRLVEYAQPTLLLLFSTHANDLRRGRRGEARSAPQEHGWRRSRADRSPRRRRSVSIIDVTQPEVWKSVLDDPVATAPESMQGVWLLHVRYPLPPPPRLCLGRCCPLTVPRRSRFGL